MAVVASADQQLAAFSTEHIHPLQQESTTKATGTATKSPSITARTAPVDECTQLRTSLGQLQCQLQSITPHNANTIKTPPVLQFYLGQNHSGQKYSSSPHSNKANITHHPTAPTCIKVTAVLLVL